METERNKIVDKSRDREYFGQWPQIVWALCRTPYDFTLWNVIKMIAGETGECYLSTPDLAALAMMSIGKVHDSRDYLMKVGLLKGEKRKDPGYPQEVWHITIPDIWEENIVWRKSIDSLKERIELKQSLTKAITDAGIRRRIPAKTDTLDGLVDNLHVESFHNMKLSQCEKGTSQNEKGTSRNETKKNHSEIQTDNPHTAPSAAPAPPKPAVTFDDLKPAKPLGKNGHRSDFTPEKELALLVGNRSERGSPAGDADCRVTASGWEIRGPDAPAIRQALIHLVASTPLDIPNSDNVRGYWYKELKTHVQEFTLDDLPDLYKQAYQKLKDGNLTVKGPGSLTGVMMDLNTERKHNGNGYVPPGMDQEKLAGYKILSSGTA